MKENYCLFNRCGGWYFQKWIKNEMVKLNLKTKDFEEAKKLRDNILENIRVSTKFLFDRKKMNFYNKTNIYFVQAENGLIKIGKSIDVPKRMYSLKGTSPIDVQLIHHFFGYVADEQMFHTTFAEKGGRHHAEWFYPTPALVRHIRKLKGEVYEFPAEKELAMVKKDGVYSVIEQSHHTL